MSSSFDEDEDEETFTCFCLKNCINVYYIYSIKIQCWNGQNIQSVHTVFSTLKVVNENILEIFQKLVQNSTCSC